MAIDIDVGASGVKETALRRAFWNLADKVVLSRTTVLPGSPTNGDIYIIVDTDLVDPNKIAFRSEGAWLLLTPEEGWKAYVADTNQSVIYSGSAWVVDGSATVSDGDKGDITVSSSGATWTIDNDVVTNAKAANVATATFKGRTTAGTGDPEDLTATQATALLNALVGDSGSGGTKGLAPAPSAGDTAAGKFLKADSTWAVPGSGFTAASTTEVLTGTDSSKGVTSDSLAALWEKGADEASAGTVSFGEGGYFHVTGTTGITDIDWDTAKDGRRVWVIFDGILTLTHNSTTLKLPGGASITTAADDRALFVQDSSDNVICLAYIRADGSPLAGAVSTARQVISGGGLTGGGDLSADRTLAVGAGTGITVNADDVQISTAYQSIGKQTIFVPASSMTTATTNGPATGQVETSSNKVNFSVLDFDATTAEQAWFHIAMPKGWDEGTITFQAWWTTSATDTDGIAISLAGVALSDNDALDTAVGTPIVVTDDAQSGALEMLVTAESAAVTIAGTPAEGDMCYFRVQRVVSDGNDDMSEDMRLIGIKLFYTTNAANDA